MSLQEKPSTAYVLSLLAGILIMIGAISNLVFRVFFIDMFRRWLSMNGFMPSMMMNWFGSGTFLTGIIGLVFGVIVIYCAIMLNSNPKNHVTYGSLILIFSVFSFVGALGGLGLGLILGIIGGVLAISWQPPSPTSLSPKLTSRFCAYCGKPLTSDARFCPSCGKEQPSQS